MHDRLTLRSFRLSLFAALGIGALACGSSVETGGQGGGGQGAGCPGATPVKLPDGSDSGYLQCPDGSLHRAAAVACDPTISALACQGTEPQQHCKSDADCTDGPHGKCIHKDASFIDGPEDSCGCVYSCASDDECGPGGVCVCPSVVSTGAAWARCATSATCQVDADCPGGECGIASFSDGCGQRVSLRCRSADDTCRVDADCMENFSCAVDPYQGNGTESFACVTENCAIGRPLLVAGEARVAEVCPRGDWILAELSPDTSSLDPALRSALAAHWAEIAALEHASVASFARFSLQLMALGAPPDLLLDAQRAAADEILHAQIAYALASRYADKPLGPSSLDLAGVPIEADRDRVLAALIEEACVGETLGAAEAIALAGMVEDPALRSIHARIAEDEQRHAELAWKTLRFLLASGGEETRRFARATFDRAMEALSADPAPRAAVAEHLGLLSARQIGAIRRRALRDVVRPCMEAILAPVAEESGAATFVS